MKYFIYKRLMKKRRSFANMEILFGFFLNKYTDEDKKILLNLFYKVNVVITFISMFTPLFIYLFIYSYSFFNQFFVSTIYFLGTLFFTDINNDDYDSMEIENVSQWMYRSKKNRFRIFLIKKLLLTFGTKVLFYCFFTIIILLKINFSFILIILFELLILLVAILIIIAKFILSNHHILHLFIYGPNNIRKKRRISKYSKNPYFNEYLNALFRSFQNRTYYTYLFFTYLFSLAMPFILSIITFYFNINKIIVTSVYLALESSIVNLIVQGIINNSMIFNNSNLSDFYYIKKFDKKKYYELLLQKFLSRKLIVILISYFFGIFILNGFTLFTAITILCSVICYFYSIKIITYRVYQFRNLSIEDVKNNFFIYFFNPIEDLFVLGLPFILCSIIAAYSVKSNNIYLIMGFFIVYSIFLLLYNFLKTSDKYARND